MGRVSRQARVERGARGDDDVRRRLDPLAGVVEARVGVDGANDGVGGGSDGLGILDDVLKGRAEIASTAREQADGVGVAIEAGAAGKMELVPDVGDAAPLKKGFLDGVAVGMAADGAVALVVGEGRGAGRALELRFVMFRHFHNSFSGAF